jgi:hypothetical protein
VRGPTLELSGGGVAAHVDGEGTVDLSGAAERRSEEACYARAGVGHHHHHDVPRPVHDSRRARSRVMAILIAVIGVVFTSIRGIVTRQGEWSG